MLFPTGFGLKQRSRWFLIALVWGMGGNLLAGRALAADEFLHDRIDQLIAAGSTGYAALAAPVAGDAEFLRRVSLDLNGTIPPAAECRAFLNSTEPDKRSKLVDRLLASPAYARHMQRVFDAVFMQRLPANRIPAAEWHEYLRKSFAENKPYDQLVREILGSDGSDSGTRPAARFYLDRDAEVHRVTRDVAKTFLGVNLECAQCHNHPQVEDYKQAHYYGLSAFLTRSFVFQKAKEPACVAEKAEGEVTFESVFDIRDKISKGPQTTLPRLFEGPPITEPRFEKGQEYKVKPEKDVRPIPKFSRRSQLGNLLTGSENVRFQRATANRLWSLMLGRGLIEPLDYDHSDNPPSHPELLNLLVQEIVRSKYNVKGFLREIALSQTYQRGSFRPAEAPPVEPSQFAQARLKPLSPEQFASSVLQATGLADAERQALGEKCTDEALAARLLPHENRFASLFAHEPGKPKDAFEPSVHQALYLANGIQGWVAARGGNLMDRLLKLPADKPAEIADELYLSVLTRKPVPEEVSEVQAYLADRAADRTVAFQELVWALLMSAEFRFNH